MCKQPMNIDLISTGSDKYTSDKNIDTRVFVNLVRKRNRASEYVSEVMSERRPNDSCRICRTSFKVKFGNIPGKQVYSSSENLFKPSQRKDSPGVVLAEVCSRVGLVFLHDPVIYSDRVCNPCGRKIRSLGQLFEFVKAGTTPTFESVSKSTKRTLATPEKASPSWRKSKAVRVNSPTAKTLSPQSAGKSRKSLAFGAIPVSSTQKEDEMLSNLNVDDLPQTGLQVKVVYMIPSGTVTTRVPRDEQTKNLVKNIACENWREVSNAILKHKELAPVIIIAIRKAVFKEFSDYLKCDSMLLATNPDELAGFSNKLFMEEIRIHCPVWFNCQLGASGLSSKEEAVGGRVNSMALASSTLARLRNPQASAVHYRISTILFHSGVKHDDLNRLNRLGVCMSPDSIVRLQGKMNMQLEGKVDIWRSAIEENRGALKLAKEVLQKQVALPHLDVSKQHLESYEFFSTKGHECLITLLNEEVTKTGANVNTTDCMQIVIKRLEGTKLPLYK